ncbi:MAG: glycosyltransferase [Vicinamibacteria bacterium]|nr:glycosyltransferase [Vicinamibacteria bacterium]
MRLLLVHQGWPDATPGGSELHVAELAVGLAARGHEVAVLAREGDPTLPDGALCEAAASPGVRLWRLNNTGRHARDLGTFDLVASHALRQVIATWRPDLVHAHHVAGFGSAALQSVRAGGCPLVLTLHDHWPSCLLGQLIDRDLRPCPGPAPARCATCLVESRVRGAVRVIAPAAMAAVPALRRPFERRQAAIGDLLRAADGLIAPSEYFARRLVALGWPQPRVVAPGLPLRTPVPRVPRDPAAPLRIGFVGSLIPSKGVHVLVDAVAGLGPAYALELHGPAPLYHGDADYAARLREGLGARAAALRGPFPAAELASRLAALDVLVVPSLWEENAPRVVDEAFVGGVVPVVSGHGRLAEAVRDGIDGLHFTAGDAGALRAALLRLREEPDLLPRLAAAAPRPPTLDAMLDGHESVYRDAAERFRSGIGRVGVVVLDRGAPERTARTAASALDAGVGPQVLVVHNGPGLEGPLPEGVARLRLPANGGYAAGMNAGIVALREGGCDRVLLLNNDARLERGALRALAEAVGVAGVAAASPVVFRAGDGRVESAGLSLGPALLRPRLRGHGARVAPAAGGEVEALSGVALMLSLPALAQVGPLREDYFHGFEDVDLSLRLRRAGLRLLVVAAARCHHEGAATLGTASPLRIYYAARNHVRAAEVLWPQTAPWHSLRRAALLGLAMAHAVVQRDVARGAALAAAVRGARDGWRGVTGEACGP